MSYFSDFKSQHLNASFPYWVKELFDPYNYSATYRWRKQRLERGWSDRDTWGGGEYIMEVCAGILNQLQSDKGYTDWEVYFKNNYEENLGYKSLNEVADDLNLWLEWWEGGLGHYDFDTDTQMAIDWQLYEQAKEAMHFVAENIGGLWD